MTDIRRQYDMMLKCKQNIILNKKDYVFIDTFGEVFKINRGNGIYNLLAIFANLYKKELNSRKKKVNK